MSYRWRADAPTETLDRDFDSQELAEDWLRGFWEDLVDEGLTHVSLFEEERLVYGPMGLTA